MNPRTTLATRARLATVGACLGTLLWLPTSATAMAEDSLEQGRIRELLIAALPAHSHHPQVELPASTTACDDPRPFLAHPEQRSYGRVLVGVRCGQALHYVQARVSVMGTYVVSLQNIAANQVVEASMLAMRAGALERLPANAVLDAREVVGLRATHALRAGAPLIASALRKTWLVEQNHQVAMQFRGAGFVLSRQGKALDNGYLGDEVRVVPERGRVLRATVTGPDQLMVRD
ncbi:flagellar basal body P-ring formation chaperone FlgA [Pseudomonas eucalypticola]|uniref:Flagella basal body P-ring formation protein FlgA n=1 Tax=Pseudomonas eucalypticola TaxID=2599595 RepID=A0A7D5HGT2_9PSED|nr:flagellar basal body P-ring formation chaperone FlgA [Pseudomonas eucalypticola]QKZ07330.1 flagellar basal body P-ring formation protein FlgA [Pseudomonas eucalypticola]